MIQAEHEKYGSILIIEPSDKNHKLLKFGNNKEGIETMLSCKAGFANSYPDINFIVYRDIEQNHIHVKTGTHSYTKEFEEFILNYGKDWIRIKNRWEILDL